MYMRLGLETDAEVYRRLIIEQFPESAYGMALRNPDYIDNLRNMDARQQELYERTYEAYLENRNSDVHEAYRTMEKDYPLSKIMPKFMFLHALAYVTENKPDEFNATLRTLLERYPSTDITHISSAWLKGMANSRKLHSGRIEYEGYAWDLKGSNDSYGDSTRGGAVQPSTTEEPQSARIHIRHRQKWRRRHCCFDEIARHNFSSFVCERFRSNPIDFGRLGLIDVGGFEQYGQLNHYRTGYAESG